MLVPKPDFKGAEPAPSPPPSGDGPTPSYGSPLCDGDAIASYKQVTTTHQSLSSLFKQVLQMHCQILHFCLSPCRQVAIQRIGSVIKLVEATGREPQYPDGVRRRILVVCFGRRSQALTKLHFYMMMPA